MTAKTHFDRAIEEEQAETVKAVMRIQGPDAATKLADLQGFYRGLEKARELFRKAAQKDLVE